MKKLGMLALVALLMLITPVLAEDVSVGLYLLNLGKFEVGTGAFTADFYLSMKCDNCSLDSYEFMNGRAASIDKIIDEPHEKFYRIQANLNSPIDLKRFPFDQQKLQIILEDKIQTVDEVAYTPLNEETDIDDSIVFTGWNINGWDVKIKNHEYAVYNETYSQYVYTVTIERIAINSFFKTFLPVLFIIIVVLSSFVLDPDKIITRLGMAGSSLIAAVMFHISITNQIPPVGYLTFADKFMILTYFVLLAIFVINIVMLELHEQKKMEIVEKMHRRTEYSMFVVVPILYILLFLFFL